jgi:hypothetical protein
MNSPEMNQEAAHSTSTGEGNQVARKVCRGKRRKKRHFSAQALARMGRKPTWPEATILARRFGVSYGHALRVAQGKRPSPLASELPAIRAELRAAGGGPMKNEECKQNAAGAAAVSPAPAGAVAGRAA